MLDVELSLEALLAELEESAACSASNRVCRSLDSLEDELDGGGGGGGGPPGGGGPLGGPAGAVSSEESLEELTALTDETEAALEVDEALDVWPAAARSSRSSCQLDELLAELTELTDIGPVPSRGRSKSVRTGRE